MYILIWLINLKNYPKGTFRDQNFMYCKIHCTVFFKEKNGLNILPCQNYEIHVYYKMLNTIFSHNEICLKIT